MITLYDMAQEARQGMVQALIAEGATGSRDYAVDVLLRAGYRPGAISVFLDEAIAEAREFMTPPCFENVVFIRGARP